MNCKLFIPRIKKIINPDLPSLNEAIINSSAARFVHDPRKFLDDIDE